MDNNLIIKVCGMRALENIQSVTTLNIDWLGFIHFPKSKRHITLEELEIAIQNVPNTIEKVGVVVNPTLQLIQGLQQIGITIFQLHGDESPKFCEQVSTYGKVIKVFSVGSNFDFEVTKPYETVCDYFLFDAKGKERGGNGIQYDWDILQEYKGKLPFLLSGGIEPKDVKAIQAFNHPQCVGIDVNSGFEIAPALKNRTLLKTFIKELKKL